MLLTNRANTRSAFVKMRDFISTESAEIQQNNQPGNGNDKAALKKATYWVDSSIFVHAVGAVAHIDTLSCYFNGIRRTEASFHGFV